MREFPFHYYSVDSYEQFWSYTQRLKKKKEIKTEFFVPELNE